jgi:hypothetical protein
MDQSRAVWGLEADDPVSESRWFIGSSTVSQSDESGVGVGGAIACAGHTPAAPVSQNDRSGVGVGGVVCGLVRWPRQPLAKPVADVPTLTTRGHPRRAVTAVWVLEVWNAIAWNLQLGLRRAMRAAWVLEAVGVLLSDSLAERQNDAESGKRPWGLEGKTPRCDHRRATRSRRTIRAVWVLEEDAARPRS